MAKLPGIVKQLKKERDKVERQLSGLNAALRFHRGVCREKRGETTQTPQDVSEGESQDCSRTESPLEGLEGEAEKSSLSISLRSFPFVSPLRTPAPRLATPE
jgi:hypothetical protein